MGYTGYIDQSKSPQNELPDKSASVFYSKMPHGQDALDFVPNPAMGMPTLGDLEKAKGSTDHIEEVYEERPDQVVFTGGEDVSKPRTGLRKLLRRNPSYEFIREVAEQNQKDLDPAEVSKVERKLFWMIVPALAVDYAFYYVSGWAKRSKYTTHDRSTRRPCRTPRSLISRKTSIWGARVTRILVRFSTSVGSSGLYRETCSFRTL